MRLLFTSIAPFAWMLAYLASMVTDDVVIPASDMEIEFIRHTPLPLRSYLLWTFLRSAGNTEFEYY